MLYSTLNKMFFVPTLCILNAMAINLVIFLGYWNLKNIAENYNEHMVAEGRDPELVVSFYDQCEGLTVPADQDEEQLLDGTGWTTVYQANAWMYLTILILAGCNWCCICLDVAPKTFDKIICFQMCSVIPLCGGMFMACCRSNNEWGEACELNESSVFDEDDPRITFADNAK